MPSLSENRRALHMMPEIDFDLEHTVEYVKGVLSSFNCEITSPIRGSVCAFFDKGQKDTVAFRADMDALHVQELTGAPYASRRPGYMHACGHDGHTAILLELAARVDKAVLPRNVLLVFQPAEETTGGAKPICDSGVFEKYRVSRMFGLHLYPEKPFGEIFTRPGPMMAGTCELDVVFEGKSCHIAKYRQGVDAAYAAAVFMNHLYSEVRDRTDIILRFGMIHGGEYRNSVCRECRLTGTLRFYDTERYEFGLEAVRRCAARAELLTGARAEIIPKPGANALINPEGLYAETAALLKDELHYLEEPLYIAEDFSDYQARIPALYMLLGTGGDHPLHSPYFDFDESVLEKGVELFMKLI